MTAETNCLKTGALLLGLLLTRMPASLVHAKPQNKPFNSHSCTFAAYRQFDFWIGDWDVFDVDNSAKPVARVRVDPILDECVLREDYQDTNGHKGQSFNIYDAVEKVWRESWVTNRGEFLLLRGGIDRGSMVLVGSRRKANGQNEQIRGTWKPTEKGIRETAVTSVDGGKTWKPWFDLLFRPHKQ